MDMSMSSTMADMAMTSTASSTMPSSTSGMDMGGMDMGMGGSSCKISMLWNWYTIDACFLAESWHVRSSGAFAGSCIGVILLVMVLEALRRVAKEYDAIIARRRVVQYAPQTAAESSDSDSNNKTPVAVRATPAPTQRRSFKPNLLEQLTRALLHMLQFAVAYIIMLLAMYFNGYIIICIFIGAFIGAFVFNWTEIGLPGSGEEREITYCCG